MPSDANLKDVYQAALQEVGIPQGWSLELKGKSDKCNHLGFGFIHCESEEAAVAFSMIKSLTIKGRVVECKEGWSIEEHIINSEKERLRKIFVSCIKKNTNKQSLVDYFSMFGQVKDVVIGKDKSSGRKLGFCVVEFCHQNAASAALA